MAREAAGEAEGFAEGAGVGCRQNALNDLAADGASELVMATHLLASKFWRWQFTEHFESAQKKRLPSELGAAAQFAVQLQPTPPAPSTTWQTPDVARTDVMKAELEPPEEQLGAPKSAEVRGGTRLGGGYTAVPTGALCTGS